MDEKKAIFDHDNYIGGEEWDSELEEWFGRPVDEIDDSEKWAHLAELEESDYDNAKEEISAAIGGRKLVCLGTAEVWTGTKQGGFVAEDLLDAINHLQGRDYGYIGFYEQDGELHIAFQHHDGTHDVVARALTDAGQDFIDEHEYDYDMSEWDMEKRLFDDAALSEPINVW